MDNNRQEEIERYIHHQMDSEELFLFQQKMEADALLKEDVLLQQSIHNAFANEAIIEANQSSKNKEVEKLTTLLRSEKYENIFSNIKANTANYLEQQKKPSRKKYKFRAMSAIAAVFIAFIILVPFYQNNNTQTLYAKYANDMNNLPSFIEKGTIEKNLQQVEKNYKSKDYHTVIDLIHSLADSTKTQYPNVSIYLGASYFHTNNYDKALEIFSDFSTSDAYDSSKGYWYTALVYLKQEKTDEAKKILELITKDTSHYNYKKATELLQEMSE